MRIIDGKYKRSGGSVISRKHGRVFLSLFAGPMLALSKDQMKADDDPF